MERSQLNKGLLQEQAEDQEGKEGLVEEEGPFNGNSIPRGGVHR